MVVDVDVEVVSLVDGVDVVGLLESNKAAWLRVSAEAIEPTKAREPLARAITARATVTFFKVISISSDTLVFDNRIGEIKNLGFSPNLACTRYSSVRHGSIGPR